MSETQYTHPALLESLQKSCEPTGYASFYDFMSLALYHPEGGYYKKNKKRVGKTPKADFYTASSLGSVFGRLVLEASTTLMQPISPEEATFIEVGAEPGQNIFETEASAFKEHVTLRLGDSLAHLPTPSTIFANEILDAQPFHRFRFHSGSWHELGIKMEGHTINETLLPTPTIKAASFIERLPEASTEGYTIDIPSGAEELLTHLITPDWEGLLLLFDYGKTTASLLNETPQGTARAYRNHNQSNNLLATPGAQDITCHIGWEWIETKLHTLGLTNIRIESQEAYFVRHAPQTIGNIIADRPGELTPERRTLQELIHPAHLGQKFQVLSAIRKIQ